MTCRILSGAVAASMLLGGCSSRPREFTPTLTSPSANQAAFESSYATCQQLYVAGKLDQNGRSSSVGGGAAAGATTAAVGAGTAAMMGGWGGVAAASATIVLLPFALIGGAWGMAKMKRAQKEKAIRIAMTGCLHERGYEVGGWTRASKAQLAPAG